MADLGSAMPTSGGLYYWTYRYSSPKWRTLLCWIVGCKMISVTPAGELSSLTLVTVDTNTITNVACMASVDWGCAVQIGAAVAIGTDMSFSPTTSQT
jgi:amino acid transporter